MLLVVVCLVVDVLVGCDLCLLVDLDLLLIVLIDFMAVYILTCVGTLS